MIASGDKPYCNGRLHKHTLHTCTYSVGWEDATKYRTLRIQRRPNVGFPVDQRKRETIYMHPQLINSCGLHLFPKLRKVLRSKTGHGPNTSNSQDIHAIVRHPRNDMRPWRNPRTNINTNANTTQEQKSTQIEGRKNTPPEGDTCSTTACTVCGSHMCLLHGKRSADPTCIVV